MILIVSSADVEMGGPAAEPQPRPAPSPVPSPATKPAENDPTNAPFDKLAAAVNAETETVQQVSPLSPFRGFGYSDLI